MLQYQEPLRHGVLVWKLKKMFTQKLLNWKQLVLVYFWYYNLIIINKLYFLWDF